MDEERIKKLVRELLIEIGEDPTREGLARTPERIADAYREIFSGYDSNSELSVQFSEDSEVVVVRDIQFYSMCEHHMLPFFGEVSIGYIPNDTIIGISKLARTVEYYSKSLNTQEYFTDNIANYLQDKLNPLGIGILVNGRHLCQEMRGVKKQGEMVTSCLKGNFLKDIKVKEEFIKICL